MKKVKFGNRYTFGLGHIVCACLLSIEHLKPTKIILFVTAVMGTLLISVDDLPRKTFEPALVIALPLLLGAFISTVVWALAAYPTPTPNASCAERVAVATVRVVTALFEPHHGAVARNAAEPTDKDVFAVFFSSFMCLMLYYLLYNVGSLCTFALAHAIYLILLFIKEVKPRRHILAATVLLATILFMSDDHPYETLNKFVRLVTGWYIFATFLLFKAAIVLLSTIVLMSDDHPYETLNKFVWLVTWWYIFALAGLLGVCAA